MIKSGVAEPRGQLLYDMKIRQYTAAINQCTMEKPFDWSSIFLSCLGVVS